VAITRASSGGHGLGGQTNAAGTSVHQHELPGTQVGEL
jgi:hypothetical protein